MAVVKLTTETFDQEVLQAGQTVLVDFYADWCGPCKMMAPVVEELAGEEPGVKVCKINIDEEVSGTTTGAFQRRSGRQTGRCDAEEQTAGACKIKHRTGRV